jgi:hypothetical protein
MRALAPPSPPKDEKPRRAVPAGAFLQPIAAHLAQRIGFLLIIFPGKGTMRRILVDMTAVAGSLSDVAHRFGG